MKQSEVNVGSEYLTKVSGNLVKVVVTHETTRVSYGHYDGSPGGRRHSRRAYGVKRADNDQRLPKARTAAALRPVPAGWHDVDAMEREAPVHPNR